MTKVSTMLGEDDSSLKRSVMLMGRRDRPSGVA